MTTSGVQVAGLGSAKAASVGVRAGNRAAGGTSFADMMSAGGSSQKASAASAKVERTEANRAQTANTPSAKQEANSVKETAKTPETAQKTKESPEVSQGKVQEKKPGDMPEGELPEEPILTKDMVSEDSGENPGLDTGFVKSLKLFREASKILEMQKLGELKQAIMDSMQVDEEELEQLLEQIGTNMQGLLQPQLLQQLVVTAKCDGDPMRLLTDESTMNNLKTLLATAEEIRMELSEISQKIEMPELGAEETFLLQETDGNMEGSDFAQILAETANLGEEVQETKIENTGKQVEKDLDNDMSNGKAQEQKETGFSFEAVRESEGSAAAKESFADSTDSRETRNDARPSQTALGDQFLNFVADAAKTEEAEFAQLSRAEQVRAVADQILERVRVVLSDKQTSMEISLTPESLGRVTLNLVSRHGALTAHFTAQNEVAKEAIQSQMVVLRENLESQGLKVEAIEVTVSNFDFTQNGGAAANSGGQENRQRGRRGLRLDNQEGGIVSEMSEADQIAADLMERSGNQVDYTA